MPEPELPENETTEESPDGAETPGEEVPEWSKALQREQRRRSTFEKSVETKFEELKSILTKPQTNTTESAVETKLGALKKLYAESADEDALTPKTRKLIAGMFEELESRSDIVTRADLKALQTQLDDARKEAKDSDFWADPDLAPYRAAYNAEKKKQVAAGHKGTRLDGRMEMWLENHLEEQAQGNGGKTASARVHTTPGRDRVIAAGSGAKPADTETFEQKVYSGKHGNIAGIPFEV